MVDVDVVYNCQKTEWWRCINRCIQNQSINMAIFETVEDSYTNKKIIWNAIGRLLPDGIFCIRCFPENISNIIHILKDQDMFYKVIYFYLNSKIILFIFACKNRLFIPTINEFIEIKSTADLANSIIKNGKFADTILIVGDKCLFFCNTAKNLGRYVIALGKSQDSIKAVKNQGIREVYYG